MCFSRRVRLLLIVIAAGVSVSAETRKAIYRIRRYCKATSEYSPICSIGLTLADTESGSLNSYSSFLVTIPLSHLASEIFPCDRQMDGQRRSLL